MTKKLWEHLIIRFCFFIFIFNNTFLPESQIKKLDVGDDDEPVQAQPMLNQQAQATPATGQVNANRFAALFPNDPLGTAIAQKGTQRG